MDRTRFIADVAAFRQAVVLFESPQRIGPTLQDLAFAMPGRRALVARELTKLHEEVLRGTASSVGALLAMRPGVKGEIAIAAAPSGPTATAGPGLGADPGDVAEPEGDDDAGTGE